MPPNTTRVISLADVAKHNTDTDCWIIVEGNVYDATPYLSNHPGGKDIILQHKGAFFLCSVMALLPSAGRAPPHHHQPRTAVTPHHSPPHSHPHPPRAPPAGGDATQGFSDTGHSSSAKKDLANLQVGVLSEGDKAEMAKLAKEKADKAGASMGLVGFALAGVGLAAALAYQFLGKKAE